MASKVMLMKTKWYPNVHEIKHSWLYRLDTATKDTTIYPLCMYDEGLGSPSTISTNPENSAFAETNNPNVHVDSRINVMFATLRLSLTKLFMTDNLTAIRFAIMPIHMAFIDDYTAIDELSSLETQDVVEMQTESTDRQGYPLYANVKMDEKYANSALLSAVVPGLTTTQVLESVAFSEDDYYDMLHYQTNAGKLKSIQGGLKWFTLTRRFPTMRFPIRLHSATKRANAYMFNGVLIHVPTVDTINQIPITADVTAAGKYLECAVSTRFNEWNQDFNFKKV